MLEGKRKYPEINASLFRWILGILVCYGSLLVSSLIIFLFNIENLIIPALIMSFLSIMGALIIDKNILRKLFLFLNFKDVIFVFVGLIISFIFIIFASFAATYFKIGGEVNPIFGLLDKFSKSEFLISSAIQFIGEELMFVLPFLFVINKFKKTPKICGDPIKLDQIPERIYIFSGIFYAAFFSLYSIGLKYPNFSFILSLL